MKSPLQLKMASEIRLHFNAEILLTYYYFS